MDTRSRLSPDVVVEQARESGGEADRSAASDVYARLFAEGHRFDFFQAVRLLEARAPEAAAVGETTDPSVESVTIRPHDGLAFPATDVHAVEPTSGERPNAVVLATFMGLYGVASPLPTIYSADPGESRVLHDFLDIFNHRLYAFFYRAWKKYQPGLFSRSRADDEHTRRFRALTGLPPQGSEPPVGLQALLPFAGYLASPVRNAEGLQRLLAGLFENLHVRIVENVLRWVPLPRQPHVGRGAGGMRLGASAVIGRRVPDVAGMFRIELGPMGMRHFEAFLPGGDLARRLDYLVRLYAPDFLHYEVRLLLRSEAIEPVRLGERSLRLGLNSWLGRPATPVTERTATY